MTKHTAILTAIICSTTMAGDRPGMEVTSYPEVGQYWADRTDFAGDAAYGETCECDVDNDGSCTFVDLACIIDCFRGTGIGCECCINSCDVDEDGDVDPCDAKRAWLGCDLACGACCEGSDCFESAQDDCDGPNVYLGDGTTCANSGGGCVLDSPMVGDDTCWIGGFQDTGNPCGIDADCDIGEVCGVKNRYISITPTNPDDETPTAIRVTVMDCPLDPARVSEEWWVEPEFFNQNCPHPAMTVAATVCTTMPHAQVWSNGFLHLYGPAIVPGSTYGVQMCAPDGSVCGDPHLVATGKWGDVVPTFGGPAQPNFSDISAVVDKFKCEASAPDIVRADLVGPGPQSSANTPDGIANFADISSAVDAFKGSTYPYPVGSCP